MVIRQWGAGDAERELGEACEAANAAKLHVCHWGDQVQRDDMPCQGLLQAGLQLQGPCLPRTWQGPHNGSCQLPRHHARLQIQSLSYKLAEMQQNLEFTLHAHEEQ